MYTRGDVVKGPNHFSSDPNRPYIALNDDTHPFSGEKAIYAVITSTARSDAIPITADDFQSGGLRIDPSYASPWSLVTLKHDDILDQEGILIDQTTNRVAGNAAHYLDP